MPDSYSLETRRQLEALEQRLNDALFQFLALTLRVQALEAQPGELGRAAPQPPDTARVIDQTASFDALTTRLAEIEHIVRRLDHPPAVTKPPILVDLSAPTAESEAPAEPPTHRAKTRAAFVARSGDK